MLTVTADLSEVVTSLSTRSRNCSARDKALL